MSRGFFLLRASVVVFALSSCAQDDLIPRTVPLDRANCAQCGMMVSDHVAAAQAVFAGDDPRFYDDIGCLVHDSSAWSKRVQPYVPADGGERWLKAEKAFYGRPADARTPMGFDFVAYETMAQATERDRDGRGRTWGDLVAELSGGPS